MNRLLLAGLFAAVIAVGTPARAQNYPWCAESAGFGSLNCGYATYAQCMAPLFGNSGAVDRSVASRP